MDNSSFLETIVNTVRESLEEKWLNGKQGYMAQLRTVATDLSGILKENFVGFYLMGSFVMGDWDPEKSDIDFIAVTKKPLNKRESVEIGKLHLALSKSDLGKKLEGAYTYLEQLQQKRFEEKTGSVEDHEFKADCPCHLSADNILCLLEYGVCVQGVPIEELSLSVSEEELSDAAYKMLVEYAAEIDQKEDFQALYEILINILRCIYTMEERKLPTKSRAIAHCRNLLGRDLYRNVKAFRGGKVDRFIVEKGDLKRIAAYASAARKRRQNNWVM